MIFRGFDTIAMVNMLMIMHDKTIWSCPYDDVDIQGIEFGQGKILHWPLQTSSWLIFSINSL